MLLTAFSAGAVSPCANDSASMISPCKAGREFTMRIPVRLPAGVTAEYMWYRNCVAIPSSLGTVGVGGGMVTYTIPAVSAWGVNQQFYFQFRLSDDDCADCWDSSPQYLITWNDSVKDVGCKNSGGVIAGDTLSICSSSGSGGEIRGAAVAQCAADAGGEIRGAVMAECWALDGGFILGEAAVLCEAGSGGKIGGVQAVFCGQTGGEIRGERLDQFPTDGYDSRCVVDSGGVVQGALPNLCAATGGEIRGAAVQTCSADNGGEIRGETIQQCSATDGGEIRGETIQQCSAIDGGVIRGAAVQTCSAVDGGKIRGN